MQASGNCGVKGPPQGDANAFTVYAVWASKINEMFRISQVYI